MKLAIARESPLQPDNRALIAALDAHANALYPPSSNHLVDAETLEAEGVRFFAARADGVAVGCGGYRRLGPDAEIKRMFVADAARGLGVGRAILSALEAAARDEAVAVLRLETGTLNTEALGLYRSTGFVETGPFGSYGPDKLSVFMAKSLQSG
jgi:putative acetyltransferase